MPYNQNKAIRQDKLLTHNQKRLVELKIFLSDALKNP